MPPDPKRPVHFVLVGALVLLVGYGVPRALHALDTFVSRQRLDETQLPELIAEAQTPLVLFTTETCPYCRQARELLDRLGAPYAVRQVDVSDSAREQFARLGGKGVPILVSQDRVISGYDESAYRELIATALD